MATEVRSGRGRIPVADFKVGKYISGDDDDEHFDSGPMKRSCYSFCMCPGGQVVLTSTNTSELCINGMSFSQRASKWANAALIVTVSSKDFESLNFHGPLAGVEFQEHLYHPRVIDWELRQPATWTSLSARGYSYSWCYARATSLMSFRLVLSGGKCWELEEVRAVFLLKNPGGTDAGFRVYRYQVSSGR
ncbi:hypothetical protein RHMOL_Rhmol02G0183200 [Rhododendron molle]|uniref:Uncharacterized protein n=1 Tax=Rhododendron molle TaxID=49168 RepID=A0ACC0PR66_RHOML|nr:hypothetical protein RHMOL_Rhmol02G0183200 [Rhododendron molle]